MLVQPGVPVCIGANSGYQCVYHPSSSSISTPTAGGPPLPFGNILSSFLPTTGGGGCPSTPDTSRTPVHSHPFQPLLNSLQHSARVCLKVTPTPSPHLSTMPRQPQSKPQTINASNPAHANLVNQSTTHAAGNAAGVDAVLAVAGGKRATQIKESEPVTTGAATGSVGDLALRLPPKLRETERMMHVQRWVNNLPWTGGTTWNCSADTDDPNAPPSLPLDDHREHTPPPGREYLSRLPLGVEEQQVVGRLFATSTLSDAHAYPSPNRHNPYAGQTQLDQQHMKPLNVANPALLGHADLSSQAQHAGLNGSRLLDSNGAVRCVPSNDRGKPSGADRLVGRSGRMFTEWETRLVRRLFEEFFTNASKIRPPGGGGEGDRPDGLDGLYPAGGHANLPSLGEVRARIASSRLRETRTATAVRAKIKRMQSSGNWSYH